MSDPRYAQLANVLVGFSTNVKKDEKVLIEASDVPDAMVNALVRAVQAKKALPYVQLQSSVINRAIYSAASEQQFAAQNEWELARMQMMECYIGLRGSHNIFETSDVPGKRMATVLRELRPTLNHRVQHTRWCVLRWPTSAMAQQALMSTEAFEDFYFDVCTADYARMQAGMEALKSRMESTDLVEIKGPGTDLRFSIKGMPAITCGGHHNLPDGEVFSAPVKDSVEGVISYNAPTIYQGVSFDNIRFEFEHGKIVNATSSSTKRMNQILDSDEGARYIGEFAIGFNPYITEPMRDILFDEKIAGSFHLTPGQAYEIADNGNRSQIHWDIVNIQRKDWGGGTISLDGEVIRENGLFVPKDLQRLNPDYLLGRETAGKAKGSDKVKKASSKPTETKSKKKDSVVKKMPGSKKKSGGKKTSGGKRG